MRAILIDSKGFRKIIRIQDYAPDLTVVWYDKTEQFLTDEFYSLKFHFSERRGDDYYYKEVK